MNTKVRKYIDENNMLKAGDAVAAGISGGADSVCLLFLLSKLRKEIPFTLYAVHINHGIRPEAGEDAAYVAALCRQWEIPFFLWEENVEKLAKEQKISTEEAGRNVRYAVFEKVLRKEAPEAVLTGRAKIATAHNAGDRAETTLFHLFRGTGLKGLVGMRPVREGEIPLIRPLLCTRRDEIEAFLREKEISYCIDRTNEDDTYTRNRIRHHILPYAEAEIVSGCTENINRASEILAETEDYIRGEAQKAYAACLEAEKEGRISLRVRDLQNQPVFLQKQVILLVFEKISAAARDITHIHVEQALSLFSGEGNRRFLLPGELSVRREYDKVFFQKEGTKAGTPFMKEEYPNLLEKCPDFLSCRIFSYEKNKNFPKNPYTKWFDYDKIKGYLAVRTRRAGDYLTINEAGNTKTLQDYMVNEKIPAQKRKELPLIAEGSHILWVIGYRISSFYKIDDSTETVLEISYRSQG